MMNSHVHSHALPAELIRSVLESAPDAMIIVDRHGSVLFANSHAAELFGYPDNLVGTQIEELLPERFRAAHVAHRARYVQNGRPRPMGSGLELFGLRRDGAEFPVEISLSPVRCEPDLLIVAAIRDMTAHMRTERELSEARAQADRANLAKSRFLATASHDLRQPLQALALLNATLRRLVATPEALDAVGQQDVAIGTMGRLLNALLDISKLESGAIKPAVASFAVGPLFDQMRTEFSGLAHEKGLELNVEHSAATALSDMALVGQVVRNLLSNAIKYTERGSITLGCQQCGDHVRIDVRDTGVGIPPEQIGYIYDEFYQVGVDSRESRNGYGLGLSIVQRIVRLLQLRIDVTSEPGVGSTFSLTLPAGATLQAGSSEPANAQPRRTVSHAKPHVLLVEDDPGVRNATRLFLKTEGYRVTAAASAEEAVQRASESLDINVIVSDFHLGNGQTGADAVASIRDLVGARIAAILVTGDTSSAMREIVLDEQMRITRKPINADEMLALLKDLLAS